MPEKLKILVSAYACSPSRGSEPGMGWNFVVGLSKFHKVHVIVEKLKWENEIDEYLASNPGLKENLTFHFIEKERNKRLRKIWPPSYYWYYRKWQKKAFLLAITLDTKEHFDVVHQLNMVGFREPGYLWKMSQPFVWGPIGGLENSPWKFLPSLGWKGLIHYTGRNLMNWGQRRFLTRTKKAATREKCSLIAATAGNAQHILKLWGQPSQIICEVGQESNNNTLPAKRQVNEKLRIIWSGLHTPRKNLPLLLNALTICKIPFELHILGIGSETKKWKELASKLGIASNCNWYGWLERKNAIEIMQNGHVFCITSIKDETSTVALEAISYGLPVVCLDHCGFADVITDKCGIKIPVSTPKQASRDFADALTTLYNNESYRYRLATGAIERSSHYSWDKKIEQLNQIYSNLVSNSTH